MKLLQRTIKIKTMQTATEWLFEQLDIVDSSIMFVHFEQAKEMEKQQIIEARNDMQKKCINLANKINPFLFEFNEKDAEQYYNETFKK